MLSLDALTVQLPDGRRTQPLTLTIGAGQSWGVLGPNGAGKTTLLHTLAGLRAPAGGEVRLEGRSLAGARRRWIARRLALLLQHYEDSFPASVLQSVLVGRHPHTHPWRGEQAEDRRLARAALARLDLSALAPRAVGSLSGGERRRVAMAAVLTQQPQLYLLDEPFDQLDPAHQQQVHRVLVEERAAGRAICLTLHDLNMAARCCSHLLLLHADGRVEAGPAPTLLDADRLGALFACRLHAHATPGGLCFTLA
ncbi:MAG: ABC transporter ATP-binding protein [Pseudomonadota bacterium]|nr:ABC transporter ATP-binding protein [Pseudomonadota bacterium]HJO36635.1 ABC transporter ATP-binding protein [Gammaproteobacteria bacterium]